MSRGLLGRCVSPMYHKLRAGVGRYDPWINQCLHVRTHIRRIVNAVNTTENWPAMYTRCTPMYTLYTPFFLYFYNRSFYQKPCTHGEKRGPINNSMALNSEETYDKLTSRKITQVCDVKRYVGGVVCDPVPHRLYSAGQGRWSRPGNDTILPRFEFPENHKQFFLINPVWNSPKVDVKNEAKFMVTYFCAPFVLVIFPSNVST